jgi:hypothetical protein
MKACCLCLPLIVIIPDLRPRKTGEPPRTARENFRQDRYALIEPVRHPKRFPTKADVGSRLDS